MAAPKGNRFAEKDPADLLDTKVLIRTRAEEKVRWQAAARAEKMSLSAWINKRLKEA